jgi:hypothetical protein
MLRRLRITNTQHVKGFGDKDFMSAGVVKTYEALCTQQMRFFVDDPIGNFDQETEAWRKPKRGCRPQRPMETLPYTKGSENTLNFLSKRFCRTFFFFTPGRNADSGQSLVMHGVPTLLSTDMVVGNIHLKTDSKTLTVRRQQ